MADRKPNNREHTSSPSTDETDPCDFKRNSWSDQRLSLGIGAVSRCVGDMRVKVRFTLQVGSNMAEPL